MPTKSLDVLILFILVLARVQLDTLADNVLPDRLADTRRLVEGWWPAWSLDRLAHPQTDQVSTLLIGLAFGLLGLYLLVDRFVRAEKGQYRLKLGLIYGIILLLVVGKTTLLMNLRHLRGPASYAHDGGVIQTEVTIQYFLNGLNPYVEDYVNTPMAEWGLDEYRTALYHYPYLPWTFIFAAPFYAAAQGLPGWFDMRFVYLILFVLTLVLAQSLAEKPQHKLIIVALIGLNPISTLNIIFGVNDPFVLFWIVLGLWLLERAAGDGRRAGMYRLLGSAAFGLACASKPTAWFLAPFWLLYLMRDVWGSQLLPQRSAWPGLLMTLLRRAWPLPVVALLIIGPWFAWNPDAMYDDVWRWSAGQGETGYQIWGWGASNFVLAFGLVEDRFDYWPFIIPGAIVGLPLLWLLLKRQVQDNTAGAMLYGYVIFLFIFFYLSRFMQPNYLGYLLDFLALAYLIKGYPLNDPTKQPEPATYSQANPPGGADRASG
jgi:hypothetical protein